MTEAELEAILNESDFFEASSDDDDDNFDQAVHENVIEKDLSSDSSSDSEDSLPLKHLQRRLDQGEAGSSGHKLQSWRKKTFDSAFVVPEVPESWECEDTRTHWTPFDYFSQYFNEDFWGLIANQSNRRALQENVRPLNATSGEYKKLVGAHIITGVLKLPRLRLYYRKALRVPGVTEIPRDRFFRLRNYLHFVDNLAISKEEKEKIDYGRCSRSLTL